MKQSDRYIPDLAIGTVLMFFTTDRWNNYCLITSPIAKINKTSYTLKNKDVVFKEDLRIRGGNSSFYERYEVFEQSKYNEYMDKVDMMKYESWKCEMSFKALLNIDFMKRYLEEHNASKESDK